MVQNALLDCKSVVLDHLLLTFQREVDRLQVRLKAATKELQHALSRIPTSHQTTRFITFCQARISRQFTSDSRFNFEQFIESPMQEQLLTIPLIKNQYKFNLTKERLSRRINCSLQHVYDFTGLPLTSQDLNILFDLLQQKPLSKIKTLKMVKTGLDDSAIEVLADRLAEWEYVGIINVANNYIGLGSMQHLQKEAWSRVRQVILTRNPICKHLKKQIREQIPTTLIL